MCGRAGSGQDALGELRDRYGLRLVAMTRGERGARLLGVEGTGDCTGLRVMVEDTVGAGDAYIFRQTDTTGAIDCRDWGRMQHGWSDYLLTYSIV